MGKNNINSPLVLSFKDDYKVNKLGDQSGEYVSKEIANELLNTLKDAQVLLREIHGKGFEEWIENMEINRIIENATHE